MGETTQLDAMASDPDGDTLSYSWAQTAPGAPQGSFGAQSSSSTTWTAPTVSAATRFTLSVTVSDGRGGTVTSPVPVYAKTSSDPSFLADVQPLLALCSTFCHTTGSVGPLAEYATLVNVPAKIACPGQPLVKPGDPDNSVLFETVAGTNCESRMPPNGPYYGTDQLNRIRTWILQGAANN